MYIVNCHQFPLFKVSISKMDCKLPSSDGVDSCTKSGRPSFKNKPYGMSDTEYSELVTFLDSPQSNPVYPLGFVFRNGVLAIISMLVYILMVLNMLLDESIVFSVQCN